MDKSRRPAVGTGFFFPWRRMSLSAVLTVDEMRSVRRLWWYGLGMVVPMVYFAWRYPLAGNSNSMLDIGKMSQYQADEYLFFLASLVVLFTLYILALQESRNLSAQQALRPVFTCATLLGAAMTWMYPVNATDIYIYAWRSRLFTHYGVNPIRAYFKDYPADPWMHFASEEWSGRVSPYGPLWNLLGAPITYLADNRIAVALLGFKLLAFGCFLLCGWIIVLALQASSQRHSVVGAIFFLWNPLVLWEAIGNGHNDIVMLVPILLAFLAWFSRRDSLVIPLLLVATLIKYLAAPLIPLAAIALMSRARSWPQLRKTLGESIILSLLWIGIAFYPFYDFGALRQSVAEQSTLINFSPAAVARNILHQSWPQLEPRPWIALASGLIALVSVVWQMGRVWRQPMRLPRAAFEVTYVLLLVSLFFRPWYVIMLVGIAPLLRSEWPMYRTIVWAICGMLSYAFFIWIAAWFQLKEPTVLVASVLLTFGLTLLLTVMEWMWGRNEAIQSA